MKKVCIFWMVFSMCSGLCLARKEKVAAPSALDRYLQDATQRSGASKDSSPGSLYSPAAHLYDVARDLRASQVDDILEILVVERASAVAKGTTKAARSSSAKNSITALAGPTKAAGILSKLAALSGSSQLDGQGATSRDTVLTTTLSARVLQVMPNGNLIVEGIKDVQVNSERQMVTIRGIVRPVDVTPANQVRSDQVAQMEVRINGKGVVGDVVRRPFILYRVLLGLLPF